MKMTRRLESIDPKLKRYTQRGNFNFANGLNYIHFKCISKSAWVIFLSKTVVIGVYTRTLIDLQNLKIIYYTCNLITGNIKRVTRSMPIYQKVGYPFQYEIVQSHRIPILSDIIVEYDLFIYNDWRKLHTFYFLYLQYNELSSQMKSWQSRSSFSYIVIGDWSKRRKKLSERYIIYFISPFTRDASKVARTNSREPAAYALAYDYLNLDRSAVRIDLEKDARFFSPNLFDSL